MNRLNLTKRALLAACFVEGTSIRSAARLTKCVFNTALKHVRIFGDPCQAYHDKHVRDLKKCTHVEADELWSFIHAKDRNLPDALKDSTSHGDMWSYVSMCSDSKLVICWRIGKRTPADALLFAEDLASRIPNRVQISTDQLQLYRPAIETAFGDRADYATLSKKLGEIQKSPDQKFTQPKIDGERKASVYGNPDLDLTSTSGIERQNLTIRMSMRRYTRSTNAFSRKIENKRAALALHFTYYNFCRIHSSLRVTPAMEAGISDRVWDIEDLVRLSELPTASPSPTVPPP